MLKPDQALLERDLEWLGQPNHHLLTIDQQDYPALLRKIPRPPAALFIDGNPDLLWQPQLAIVGSRNPTAGGRDNAAAFSSYLAGHGLVITSGLADGVDSIAHQAALDSGGTTIAVLGTGVDKIYPARNRELAGDVAASGALVSEFPLGSNARPGHFPARNRIISGLSLGTLVVEAGMQSGSLITAGQATEQGREVFAIPGSIHNPMARGCHRLLKQGAKLVETADDIVQELGSLAEELAQSIKSILHANEQATPVEVSTTTPNISLDPDYQQLWSSLSFDPKPVDQLIEQTGLAANSVSSMLLMLELRGMVEAHQGGAFSRK